MTRAATRLRITQSAVSKRIAALEADTGHKLIEPVGRKVRLTPLGVRLLEKTRPFLAGLEEALTNDVPTQGGRIIIGISESILCSWGASLLARVRADMPDLEFIVNTHRKPRCNRSGEIWRIHARALYQRRAGCTRSQM